MTYTQTIQETKRQLPVCSDSIIQVPVKSPVLSLSLNFFLFFYFPVPIVCRGKICDQGLNSGLKKQKRKKQCQDTKEIRKNLRPARGLYLPALVWTIIDSAFKTKRSRWNTCIFHRWKVRARQNETTLQNIGYVRHRLRKYCLLN